MTEPENPTPVPPVHRRRRRWVWGLSIAGVVLLVLLVGGELFARYYLGLGDPPLSVADPEVEYRFAPGVYHRFGHVISYNEYSMRSGPITPHKTDPAELRVMMIGDSIINGGALTDDHDIATYLLQTRLAARLHRPVKVCNVSAGSWGPPNEAAYLDKFGWFDADALVIVVSSHDGYDVPTFNPIIGVSPEFPSRRPLLALTDLFQRYTTLGRWLMTPKPPGPMKPEPADGPEAERICRAAIDRMLGHAKAAGIPAFLVTNWERPEVDAGRLNPPADVFKKAAAEDGVPLLDFGPVQARSIKAGTDPYRDFIHPNATGQRLLADLIEPPLTAALASTAATRPEQP